MRHRQSLEHALVSANLQTRELLFFLLFDHRNKLKDVENCLHRLNIFREAEASSAPHMEMLGFGLHTIQGILSDVQAVLDMTNCSLDD